MNTPGFLGPMMAFVGLFLSVFIIAGFKFYLPLCLLRPEDGVMEIVKYSQRTIRRQVPQILSMMGIANKADKYPDELSAGEQQRVAIARAVINNPKVLIADEPTGNLDPDTAWEIMKLLEMINRRGTTIVMVTHAKDIVDRMNKRVVTIEHGHIVGDVTEGAYSIHENY
jgi:cell division transport system ATP-binding protein